MTEPIYRRLPDLERREGQKRCSRCSNVKPLARFPKNRASPDGRYSLCSICTGEAHRRRYMARRDESAAYARQYYLANRERILQSGRQWSQSNRDHHALLKRYTNARRRAARRGSAGECSLRSFKSRWEYYGGLCWICGGVADEIDHVVALARNGTNWPANLRPICRRCNQAKNTKNWRDVHGQRRSQLQAA